MSNIQLISDSSCDLSEEIVLANSIKVVPFSVTLDGGNTYLKENEEISLEKFYETLSTKSVFPKTSLPSVQQYIDVFRSSIDEGKDIICICLSSKFSGSYQSAINAMEILSDENHGRNIVVIDSQQATAAQGLLVLFAKELIDKGYELKEIERIIIENRQNCKIFFTLSSLEYLQKGGRLGKGAALVGSILNINPILVLNNGELLPESKVRGRKKALNQIVQLAKDEIGDNNINNYKISIASAENDFDDFLKVIDSTLDIKGKEIKNFRVGVTIGAHTGGTAIGIIVSSFHI